MFASASYHLFMPLSDWHYHLLLKFDLIGIGLMIFGLTLSAVYLGFHNYKSERDTILTAMSCLMAGNLCIQMTPCYTMEAYSSCRLAFYVLTLIICFLIAIGARFYIATPEEIDSFYGELIMSFVYLGVGFLFYETKFPEKCLHRARRK